jgi:hypothetical protein
MSSTPGVNGFPVVDGVDVAAEEVTAFDVVKTLAAVPADLQPANRITAAINIVNILNNLIFIAVSSSIYTALH